MTEKSLIIIGAGLAGLAAGCYAQMNGYQSHIFEHHSQPGGVAAAWKRKDYLIDGGIHFIMGHKPGTDLYEVYRQLGIVPAVRFVDMTTYGRFSDEASGRSILITQDLEQLAAELKALFPGDGRTVDELIAGARALQGLDMSQLGLSKPPELASAGDQLRDLWAMRRLLKYLVGKYGRPVADYTRTVQDPALRNLLESLFLPQSPVYFVLMLLGLLADGQMGLIEGGSLDLARAIEARYLALGGQITYRATVEEILVEADPTGRGDRAVGVRLAEAPAGRGSGEHHADAIVSAADGYGTIFKMLGGRYTNAKIRERYTHWPVFRPLLMVSFGVAQDFSDEPTFATVVLQEPLAVGREMVPGFFVRIFNYSPRFAPLGKTVVQVEFETEWDYWNDLQREDRAGYDAQKERVAAAVLQRLERYYPGISSRVEVTDVATPYSTWRYTLNHKGAWGGWLMTAEAIRTSIARTLPGLARFVMAGQWVMPGGGVSPCLYSGRHAIQLLCRQDGKDFVTSTPSGQPGKNAL